MHAALHPPLCPVGLAAYRVPYIRPDSAHALGAWEGADAAKAASRCAARQAHVVYAPAATIHERHPLWFRRMSSCVVPFHQLVTQ